MPQITVLQGFGTLFLTVSLPICVPPSSASTSLSCETLRGRHEIKRYTKVKQQKVVDMVIKIQNRV